MSEFNRGDRVRRIMSSYDDMKVGSEWVVAEVRLNGRIKVEGRPRYWWDSEYFELIEAHQTQFQPDECVHEESYGNGKVVTANDETEVAIVEFDSGEVEPVSYSKLSRVESPEPSTGLSEEQLEEIENAERKLRRLRQHEQGDSYSLDDLDVLYFASEAFASSIKEVRRLRVENEKIRRAAEQITDEGDYGWVVDKNGNTLVDVDLIRDLDRAVFPKKYEDPFIPPVIEQQEQGEEGELWLGDPLWESLTDGHVTGECILDADECLRLIRWINTHRAVSPSPIEEEQGEEKCRSYGCVLSKGHNMGRADIPENHSMAPQQEKTLREKLKAASEPIHVAGGDILGRVHFDEAERIFREHFDSKRQQMAHEILNSYNEGRIGWGELVDRFRSILFDSPTGEES